MKFKYITITEENIKIKVKDIPKAPVWRDFGYYLFTKEDKNIVILTPGNHRIILSNKEIKQSKYRLPPKILKKENIQMKVNMIICEKIDMSMTPSERYEICKKCKHQCEIIKYLKSMKKIYRLQNNDFNANDLDLIEE